MKNPFEQSPVLQKPQKLDICEHGNPKGLCDACSEKTLGLKPLTFESLLNDSTALAEVVRYMKDISVASMDDIGINGYAAKSFRAFLRKTAKDLGRISDAQARAYILTLNNQGKEVADLELKKFKEDKEKEKAAGLKPLVLENLLGDPAALAEVASCMKDTSVVSRDILEINGYSSKSIYTFLAKTARDLGRISDAQARAYILTLNNQGKEVADLELKKFKEDKEKTEGLKPLTLESFLNDSTAITEIAKYLEKKSVNSKDEVEINGYSGKSVTTFLSKTAKDLGRISDAQARAYILTLNNQGKEVADLELKKFKEDKEKEKAAGLKPLVLENLLGDPAALAEVASHVKDASIISGDIMEINGYTDRSVNTFLQKTARDLGGITLAQVKTYILTLNNQGKEVADLELKKFKEDKEKTEGLKPLALESLLDDPVARIEVGKYIKDVSVVSRNNIMINGYASRSVNTFLQKIAKDLDEKSLAQARAYILTLNNQGKEVADLELKKFKEDKEKTEDVEKLKQSLENFAQEISNAETKNEMALKIREIMALLPENACDILLKYHPEYSGLKNDYVKSVIADYLGDFLLVRRIWESKDIEKTKDLFSEEKFAEALFIKFKEASFACFQKERRANPEAKDQDLAMKYFENAELLQAASRIPEVQKTIERLKEYYEDIFKWANKKPGGIVDSLKEGRVFPDINQLVNIKEIADNGKMLIADEMGLGKSASVILAKEYFGLKCAVIVMPSNVEDTWKNYLSDKVDKDGKQKGYFKKDAVPKVLTIENKKDLERLKTEFFDYILISQEKMSKEHYLEALESIDFDMLIVDEVHKLKNIEEGIRSENAIKLAEKIQGSDKYLAMLSGTPMPNKVKDLAIVLKLLYPEEYKDTSDKDLIDHIIYDDMAGLRQELFARMQMKEVATSIEIPPLIPEDVIVKLSEEEKEVYQILLEEDDLTASEKIRIFRQFLLNPQLLGMEPGFVGAKVGKLKEVLAEDLKTKNRIIVWVNDYIDGVIRPEVDKKGAVLTEDIISKLDLPEGTVWKTIHGEDKNRKSYRQEVQDQFNADNGGKIVLFVSGQAADVGVDFSGADEVIHYNEPWSKYNKRQQESRAHREGLKQPLVVKTLIVQGTIEDGIRRHINTKEKAIEKLLRGLERTKEENLLLKKDANSRKKEVEADHDLSDDIQSGWRKLMLHFGAGWEAGEEHFKNMPEEEKESYAKLYKDYMRLSYQGNNARVSASLLEKMISEQVKNSEQLRILDIASGPEMLKRCVRENLRNQIYSMDINERHFDEVVDAKRTFRKSYLSLPVRSNSADYYNIGFAFHQTKELKFYKKNYEKLQVMAEMNRVLKVGGRAIISEIHNTEFTNPKKFEEIIGKLGMRIIKEYSDEADGGENYRAHFLILEKVSEIDGYGSDAFRLSEEEKKQKIRELGDKIGKELLSGLEIRDLPRGTSQLNDQRRMIDGFRLGGQEFKIIFTEEDRKLFDEEKKSIKDGEELKKKFGGRVDDIPLAELHKIGFKRKLRNPNLMYKIMEKGGVIVVRGEKKKKEQIG